MGGAFDSLGSRVQNLGSRFVGWAVAAYLVVPLDVGLEGPVREIHQRHHDPDGAFQGLLVEGDRAHDTGGGAFWEVVRREDDAIVEPKEVGETLQSICRGW